MNAPRQGKFEASDRAGFITGVLDRYGSRLYGYFLRSTGRPADADDLLGELMLRVVRQAGQYDEQGRLEHWLFRMAANLARDRVRRQATRPTAVSLAKTDVAGRSL